MGAKIIIPIIVVVLLLIGGIVIWRQVSRRAPTDVLCPINPSTIANPECRLHTGGFYSGKTYRMLDAVELDRNEFGLYETFDNELVYFDEIGYNPYPAVYSVIYPSDVILYKTERDTADPVKCPAHLTQYGLCDTPIDQVQFAGGVDGTIDVAITFQINAHSDYMRQLYDLGGLSGLVDLFKQVVRGNRQLTHISPTVAATQDGEALIKESFRKALDDWEMGSLIDVTSITVRSVVVGNEAFREELQEAELISQRRANAEERQALEELDREFQREQRLEDAENMATVINTLCRNIPEDECADMVWVVMFGTDMQPALTPGGEIGVQMLPTQ